MRYVKGKNNTVSKWGDHPNRRELEELIPRSVFVLDKPAGPTSHQVSSWVQRMFDRKAGHSGTLDPNATGVLPMGIGLSVRLIDYLHREPKEYVAAMKFHGTIDDDYLLEILEEFKGEIYQTPPVRSGVKRRRRSRKIYELELLDCHRTKKEYLLRVRCESGTYIRTLCKDLGKTMGTGGHMMELRRTEAGGFKEDESCTLQDLKDAMEYYQDGETDHLKDILRPYEDVMKRFPGVKVKDTCSASILNGADIAVPGILEMDDFDLGDKVSIFSPKMEGLAVGEAIKDAEEIMDMEEGLVIRTERVFHPTGDYPKRW